MNYCFLRLFTCLVALTGVAHAQACLFDDGFEPNDDCTSATGVTNLCQPGLTLSPADPDWFLVAIPAQSELVVAASVDDPLAIVSLDLFVGCGSSPVQSVANVGSGASVVATNFASSVSLHRFRLAQLPTMAPCTTYDLQTRVQPLSTAGPCGAQVDFAEPNNCCELAAPLPSFTLDLYSRASDADWFEVAVLPGQSVDVFARPEFSSVGGFDLEIYDFCGALPLASGSNFVTRTNDTLFPVNYLVKVSYVGSPTTCARYSIRSVVRESLATFCSLPTSCVSCPCGNTPTSPSGGCLNSAGTSAILDGSGSPKVSGDTLRFTASGVSLNTFAILISGDRTAPTNPSNPCFGQSAGITSVVLDGLRCVVQNTIRHGARPSDANGDIGVTTNGWGGTSPPAQGLIAQGGFFAGQSRHFQVFYREIPDQQCMTGQNTTNAMSVGFLP